MTAHLWCAPKRQQYSIKSHTPYPRPHHQRRYDPRPAAEQFLQAFAEAEAAGVVDRGKVVPLVQAWRALSEAAGVDWSWGLAAGLQRTWGVSTADLMGPDPVKMGGSRSGDE